MDAQARKTYLSSQIMTAPPEKLRLMLIDAAIRHVNIVIEHWDDEDRGTIWESSSKAQEIVTELISGVNHDANPELADQIVAIYVFIFRRMVEGTSKRELTKIQDALRILETERETWQQVCLQLLAEREKENGNMPTPSAETIPPPVLDGSPGTIPGGIPGSTESLDPLGGQMPQAGFSAEG